LPPGGETTLAAGDLPAPGLETGAVAEWRDGDETSCAQRIAWLPCGRLAPEQWLPLTRLHAGQWPDLGESGAAFRVWGDDANLHVECRSQPSGEWRLDTLRVTLGPAPDARAEEPSTPSHVMLRTRDGTVVSASGLSLSGGRVEQSHSADGSRLAFDLPWQAMGGRPRPATALGFDVNLAFVRADGERGELSWRGAARGERDRGALGWLCLVP
jgi:hypothetical protein